MKKSKKSLQRVLKDKSDKLWSEIIRSEGVCKKCGGQNGLQAAHIISRRYAQTRHRLDNGIPLCARCHWWATNNPIPFTHFLEEVLGRPALEELKEAALRMDKVDYGKVLERLKEAK